MLVLAFLAGHPSLRGQPSPTTKPSRVRLWTGVGPDARWQTPGNWTGESAPQENDDVVLDRTASKDCILDSQATVRSLTVASGYTGTIHVRAPLTITSNLVLSGKVAMDISSPQGVVVYGSHLDFTLVEQFVTTGAGGHLTLAASNGVQRLLAPHDVTVTLPAIRKINGAVLELSNRLNAVALETDRQSAIDFGGAKLKVKLLRIAGPVRELAGTEITVTGFADDRENGFDPHLGKGDNEELLDLAPAKVWRLIVRPREALKGTSAPPFVIRSARIANLDASGGDEIRAEKYIDAGGNKNVKFVTGSGIVAPAGETEVQRNSRKATVQDIWGQWEMIWQRHGAQIPADSLFIAPYQRFNFARDSYVNVLASQKPIDEEALKLWEGAPKAALFSFDAPGILRIRRSEQDQDVIMASVVTNDFVQPLRVGAPRLLTGDVLMSYLTPGKELYLQRYLRRPGKQ